MTFSSVVIGAPRCFRKLSVLLLVALCATVASANITNVVPYAESFEELPAGTLLAGTNGWYGEDSPTATNAIVVEEGYSYPLDLPIATTHTNIVVLSGSVTNLLDITPGNTNVWIDVMVLPVQTATPPDVDGGAQVAIYFNTNGHVVIWQDYYVYADETLTLHGATWSELQHEPIPSNRWIRLTVTLDYLTSNTDTLPDVHDVYYQVRLNGGDALTGDFGMPSPDWGDDFVNGGPFPTNGTWFMTANNDAGPTNVHSIEMLGEGKFDDMQVNTTATLDTNGTHKVVASVTGSGGTIYPGGTLNIPDGDDVTFEIVTLDAINYELDDVLVDGGSVGALTSVTVSNVIAARTIEAVFVAISGPVYTAQGVPESWYSDNGIAVDDNGHDDTDGVPNWEEYVAGTDPTDSNSYCRVVSVEYAGTSNKISWYATTDGGTVTNPFSMLVSTNLANWTTNALNAIERVDGTNMWWDTTPPAAPVNYRPVVIWVVE